MGVDGEVEGGVAVVGEDGGELGGEGRGGDERGDGQAAPEVLEGGGAQLSGADGEPRLGEVVDLRQRDGLAVR